MKDMTRFISSGQNARTLCVLCADEIDDHFRQLPAYNETDWPQAEKVPAMQALSDERGRVLACSKLSCVVDSVKGEDAMKSVYGHAGKAADIITLQAPLRLVELKYLVKVGGVGPFGGPGSFKKRIADKFLAMGDVLSADGEMVSTLRIIVTSEGQYPYSLAHVHGLLDSKYPAGSFSSDAKMHHYALCTSVCLRDVIDGVIRPQETDVDCFYFTI